MRRALDLFCKAGGASKGLVDASFEVMGIDLEPQPNYPFRFSRENAVHLAPSWIRKRFDFVWASPPCQFATAYKRRKSHVHPAKNLIHVTRALLKVAGVPFVIENVPGARDELYDPIQLCGSSFGLDVQRHRLFETSFPVEPLPCDHTWQTPRFPPATNRKNLRRTVEIGVWRIPLEVQQRAMGIDWMTREELSQAIPPAYAEYIARQKIEEIRP